VIWVDMMSHGVDSASAAVTSSRHDVQPRRAASMDDHDTVDDGRAAGSDDGGAVVRSAHSSPSRSHRKLTWLRKVTRGIIPVRCSNRFIHL